MLLSVVVVTIVGGVRIAGIAVRRVKRAYRTVKGPDEQRQSYLVYNRRIRQTVNARAGLRPNNPEY